MRIGVKETIDEDLLEVGAKNFLGQGVAVEFHSGEGTEVGDFFAVYVMHRQNPGGAVIGDRLRDDDVFEFLEVVADGGEIRSFLPVIQFPQQTFAKLVEQLAK